MNNHVLRPLFVVAALVFLVLLARHFIVPKDFGIGQAGYMYGWHRKSNIEDWKAVKVKYRTAEYCKDCHADKIALIMSSPHAIINCENCHGPAGGHPEDPPKLPIDRSRELCLRCHFPLPYPTSGRAKIRGIDPEQHNPGVACAECHNPHKPNLDKVSQGVEQAGHSASAKSLKASSLARRRLQPVQPSLASRSADARLSTMSCLLLVRVYS